MKSILLAFILFASGCSSLSKEECSQTNWQKKGYKDGSHGIDLIKLAHYKAECAEHGLGVNSDQYARGHKQGLVYFCTYKNGLDAGLAGEDFTPSCSSVEPSFNRGYEEGYRVFKIQELERKEAKEREDEKEDLLKKLKAEYGDKECSFNSDCQKDDNCNFNRCQESGETCQFNSDCRNTSGRCERYSRRTRFNDNVEIQLCRFRH